jgi:chaperonin cofactor prefoldin
LITPIIEEAPASATGSITATHGNDANSVKKPAKSLKPKRKIETFEQFIEYAYRRRGQPVSLPSKVEQKSIAKQISLDEATMSRLLILVNDDALLTVPRQILLVSEEVSAFPKLRGALMDFVANVMHRHQVFAHDGVKAAMKNLPDAPKPAKVLSIVASYRPPEVEGTKQLKLAELKELRRNAVNLLATWFKLNRNLSLKDLADLIFYALWEPAARELTSDGERLRALTAVEDTAGVGVTVQRYQQRVNEAYSERDQTLRKAKELEQQMEDLEKQRDTAKDKQNEITTELEALRVSSAQEIATLREAHNASRMQQDHEFESLRGRLVRQLEESVEMLDTGLSALRKETPRVSVMVERAEVVLDALRSELNSLRKV